MDIGTPLFIIVSVLVALILIAVVVVLMYIIKVLHDVRDISESVKKVRDEIDSKGLVPFLKDSQMKKDVSEEIVKKIPSLLPFITAFFVKKALSRKKKTINKNKKK